MVGQEKPLPPWTGLAGGVRGEAAAHTRKHRAPHPVGTPTHACASVCLRAATPRVPVCVRANPRRRVQPGPACVFTGTDRVCAAPSAHPARVTPRRHTPPSTRGGAACHGRPAPAARARRKAPLPSGGGVLARGAAGPGRAGPAMSRPAPPPAEPGAAIERLCQELNLDAGSAAEALRDFTALRGTYSLEVRGAGRGGGRSALSGAAGPGPVRGGAGRAPAAGGGGGGGARACMHPSERIGTGKARRRVRGGAAPGSRRGRAPAAPRSWRFPCPGRARRCTGWPAPSASPAARAWCPPWGAACR